MHHLIFVKGSQRKVVKLILYGVLVIVFNIIAAAGPVFSGGGDGPVVLLLGQQC